LNFRINLTREESDEYIKTHRLAPLLKFDQLILLKKRNNILNQFEEGLIDFPPTYKYDVGKDQYDSSEKKSYTRMVR